MDPRVVQDLFTRADGSYLFARWGRAIVPVVFGVDGATLRVVKGAIEAVVTLAGHKMAEVDPELGANLMMFFFRDWSELPQVPDLDKMVPDLVALCDRLQARGAHRYRLFRFDPQGAIKAAFVFVRIGEVGADLAETDLAETDLAAQDLALGEAVQVILLWSDRAFAEVSPLARTGAGVILRPQVAAVIQAGYAPVLPAVARSPSHGLRLAARVQILLDVQEPAAGVWGMDARG